MILFWARSEIVPVGSLSTKRKLKPEISKDHSLFFYHQSKSFLANWKMNLAGGNEHTG